MFSRSLPMVVILLVATSSVSAQQIGQWTVTNPTDETYEDEPVRLKVKLPADVFADGLAVEIDNRATGFQIESIKGTRWVWVPVSLRPGGKTVARVSRGSPVKREPTVKLRREGGHYVLDNGLLAVKVPATADQGMAPGPIASVRLPDGKWVGRSFWQTKQPCTGFTATVIGDGSVFAKVRLRYEFEGLAGLWGKTPSFAEVDVALEPGRRHVTIEERHEMLPGAFWEFEATRGWDAREAFCEIFGGAAGKPINRDMWPRDLAPLGWSSEALDRRYERCDPRIGDTLMWLIPRWNQHYEDGWLFGTSDGRHAVGIIPARAGKWVWPHDNKIEVKAKDSADYAGLRCPTRRGRRYWLLLVGPKQTWATIRTVTPPAGEGQRPKVSYDIRASSYAFRHVWRPLDKVLHDYVTDWPGSPAAAAGEPAWTRGMNPLHMPRGWLGGSHGGHSARTPLQKLLATQILLDWDYFGTYWTFWSPQNPNFFTSFMRPRIAAIARYGEHPQYARLKAMADARIHEDLYHSITLPSGAGQECPGYMSYKGAKVTGPGDTAQRAAAGASFMKRTSQPMGGGRRGYHPGGDTHPPGINQDRVCGATAVIGLKTEELEGFGVVFRNHPGTEKETYLAFKSGPNRGHYHGDQLSFHYSTYARPLAVDHHCSYAPRAGQEHMHNRVAFSTDTLPYANMDGYERVIAFKAGETADVAVGQVESGRLRITTRFPPEDWDRDHPQEKLEPRLLYRRTVVMVRGQTEDYFVIRDQHAGPKLHAHWCLHVLGEKAEREGRRIEFDGLSVFVARPKHFKFSRQDWYHGNGGLEATKGVRLSTTGRTGEYITVLWPRPPRRVNQARLKLPDAIRITRTDGRGMQTEKRYDVLLTMDLDGMKLLARAEAEVPGYNRAAHLATVSGNLQQLKLKLQLGTDRRNEGGSSELQIRLERNGSKLSGKFTGSFRGSKSEGNVEGTFHEAIFSELGRWTDRAPVAMSAVPGGVQVGEDRILFAGGIDEDPDVTYVRVERAGKVLLQLGGKEIDLNRFQGDIGLFVPDTGYPFGPIPDWLLRQRVKPRPEF